MEAKLSTSTSTSNTSILLFSSDAPAEAPVAACDACAVDGDRGGREGTGTVVAAVAVEEGIAAAIDRGSKKDANMEERRERDTASRALLVCECDAAAVDPVDTERRRCGISTCLTPFMLPLSMRLPMDSTFTSRICPSDGAFPFASGTVDACNPVVPFASDGAAVAVAAVELEVDDGGIGICMGLFAEGG